MTTHRISGRLVSLTIVALAVVLGVGAAFISDRRPSTDNAAIDADVVHVASAVPGRIIEIHVTENARVRKGAVLFEIDSVPYQIAVAQAEADLRLAEAQLETQRRALSTQRSAATVAADQARTAQANHALAQRTTKRLMPLTDKGYVPR